MVQAWGSTPERLFILFVLRMLEGVGILGGGVKSVDIEKNAKGEDRLLGHF